MFADRVEVWYADQLVDTLPRLVGRDEHAVNYRHAIDSLVRKPGAFANYAYREAMFPTTRFRIAYDRFCAAGDDRSGARDYLKVLHHAAHGSEAAIDEVLRVLLASDTPLSPDGVMALAESETELPAATNAVVEPPDLQEFDALPTLTEESHGEETHDRVGPVAAAGDIATSPDGPTDGAVVGIAFAGVPGPLPDSGRAGGEGDLEGIEAGRRVAVYLLDPVTGGRRNRIATATAGEGGWVNLAEPILVRAGDVFVAVPDQET